MIEKPFFQIGTNGIIGLGERYNSFSIEEMDSINLIERKIICPYWIDLTTHGRNSAVYYNVYRRYGICIFYCYVIFFNLDFIYTDFFERTHTLLLIRLVSVPSC